MIAAAHRNSQRAPLIADLYPIRLFQIHHVTPSVAEKEAAVVQAVAKDVAHLHLYLLLIIGHVAGGNLGNPTAIE